MTKFESPEPTGVLIRSEKDLDTNSAATPLNSEEFTNEASPPLMNLQDPLSSENKFHPQQHSPLRKRKRHLSAPPPAFVLDNAVENNSQGDWDPTSHVVSVDLGGSRLRVALVSTKGAIVENLEAPTPQDPKERVDVIVDRVIDVLTRARQRELSVLGVGISTGGRVDVARGCVLDATSLLKGWSGVELVQSLKNTIASAGFTSVAKGSSSSSPSRVYQLPVFVDNDGNCAALGESRWGAVRSEAGSMVVIATGTGIGGGIISDNGDLLRGSNYCGGELGHMVVCMENQEDSACSCGYRGCLEAIASGSALTRKAEQLIEAGELAKPEGGSSSAKALIDAALAGNESAQRVVDRATSAMSVACLNILHMLNPRHLVFTGHLARVMVEPVKRFVEAHALKNARNVEIYASKLENPALMGAASLVMEACQVAWLEQKNS